MTRNPFVGIVLLVLAAWVYLSGGTMALPSIPWLPIPGVLVAEGPRYVLIIHESADVTTARARLFTSLQTGANEAYLKSKNHDLRILDDDSVGPDGQPDPNLAAWLSKLEGMPLPVLIIADKSSKLLSKQPLPATDAEVMAAIKKAGG